MRSPVALTYEAVRADPLALHEREIGAAEAALGQGPQRLPVQQAGQERRALPEHARAVRARAEAPEEARRLTAVERAHDAKRLVCVLRVPQQTAQGDERLDGTNGLADGHLEPPHTLLTYS